MPFVIVGTALFIGVGLAAYHLTGWLLGHKSNVKSSVKRHGG